MNPKDDRSNAGDEGRDDGTEDGRKDDRPNAENEGADDQNGKDWESIWDDFNACPADRQLPPLSTASSELAKSSGLRCLIPFLTNHVSPAHRLRVLAYVIDLKNDDWRKLRKARLEARRLVRAKAKLGGDTLPPLLVPHGYRRSNDLTRALLVAAVVCAWPDEFRGKESVRHPIARKLIASGWSPPMRRRKR